MSTTVLKKENQAKGAFAGGLILENKPIGFPQDGGHQKPYSNLFYWANAWSEKGGLIGEHPHKLFEIMSFVIEGEIQHYDSKSKRWIPLHEGDAQIIRSGNGISHAERLMENSRMFQIWLDPNIQETINHDASYSDYKVSEMSIKSCDGVTYMNYVGNGGPMEMVSEGVSINRIQFDADEFNIKLDDKSIHSFYVIKGDLALNKHDVAEHDYVIVEDENTLQIKAKTKGDLFWIASPKELSYKTYRELVNF